MKLSAIAAAFGLLLAACAPTPGAETTGPEAAAPVQSADAQACARRGGEMRQVGRMQSWQCIVKYADAGKRCTDGAQCQGDCRVQGDNARPAEGQAVAGVCQADSDRFGCYTTIKNGRAEPTLCVD